jgi:hypothetical protein
MKAYGGVGASAKMFPHTLHHFPHATAVRGVNLRPAIFVRFHDLYKGQLYGMTQKSVNWLVKLH